MAAVRKGMTPLEAVQQELDQVTEKARHLSEAGPKYTKQALGALGQRVRFLQFSFGSMRGQPIGHPLVFFERR